MIRFAHITSDDEKSGRKLQGEYFSQACQKIGIGYTKFLDTEFSIPEYLATLESSFDILYRSEVSTRAKVIERHLLTNNTSTIYIDKKTAITGKGSSACHMEKNGLPVIPGIPFLPNKKTEAQDYANYFGGFPLVIKVLGGREGVGVLRVDSPESFNSIVDYIKSNSSNAEVRVMKYIPHDYYARLVVVGDSVVAATKEAAPIGDFRANARGKRVVQWERMEVTEQMERDAIRATKASGVLVGGVDLLLTENDYFISEVNCPFNFAETQQRTGVDIAASILELLTHS